MWGNTFKISKRSNYLFEINEPFKNIITYMNKKSIGKII